MRKTISIMSEAISMMREAISMMRESLRRDRRVTQEQSRAIKSNPEQSRAIQSNPERPPGSTCLMREAIRGHQRPSEAVHLVGGSSEVISGHQRSSEAVHLPGAKTSSTVTVVIGGST